MVFYGAFTAHATIRPVFHHSLPGRLITDSPAKLKQPSKSFHFLLGGIIAFAIVCEKMTINIQFSVSSEPKNNQLRMQKSIELEVEKKREVPVGQIDMNNKHHRSKLGFIKHFVKVRHVSQ